MVAKLNQKYTQLGESTEIIDLGQWQLGVRSDFQNSLLPVFETVYLSYKITVIPHTADPNPDHNWLTVGGREGRGLCLRPPANDALPENIDLQISLTT